MGHSIAEMQTEHGEIRRLTDTPMSRRACGWHRDYKLQYNCQQMGNGRSNTMGGEKICPQVVALPPNSRTSPNFPGWNMCTQSTTSTTSRLNCTLAVLVATNQFLSSSIRSSTCLDPSISTRHQSRQCRLMKDEEDEEDEQGEQDERSDKLDRKLLWAATQSTADQVVCSTYNALISHSLARDFAAYITRLFTAT
jgi:hypothetical protein